MATEPCDEALPLTAVKLSDTICFGVSTASAICLFSRVLANASDAHLIGDIGEPPFG